MSEQGVNNSLICIYYRASDDLLIEWETMILSQNDALGVVWIWSDKKTKLGTMFSVAEFENKVLGTGFEFIGEL